jgi:hypothetical protein
MAAFLQLGACSGDVNPLRDVAVATGMGVQPRQAPDFIASSRPAQLDYVPVGTSAPARPTKAKSAAEVKALEAEMDRSRAANESAGQAAAQAGATPPPTPPAIPPTD